MKPATFQKLSQIFALSPNRVGLAVSHLYSALSKKGAITGFADFHHDREFRLFTVSMMSELQKIGYKKVCLEFPSKRQEEANDSLELFKNRKISFEELTRIITKDGEYWSHTTEGPKLFTMLMAKAKLCDMEIIAMDKEGSSISQRNDFWIEQIDKNCKLDSQEKIAIVGGAYHFEDPNKQSSESQNPEEADGIDRLIKKQYPHRKFCIFTTQYPSIIFDQQEAPRLDQNAQLEIGEKNPEDYVTIGLPAINWKKIDEIVETTLGKQYASQPKERTL